MSEPLALSVTDAPIDRADAVVLYVDDRANFGPIARGVWKRTGLDFDRIATATGFFGRPGHMIDIAAPADPDCDRLVVLGRGIEGGNDTLAAWADRGGSLVAKLESFGVSHAAVVVDDPGITPQKLAALAGGARLRAYRFEKYQSRSGGHRERLESLAFHVGSVRGMDAALADRIAVVEGTLLARDLVNEPANHLGPEDMAQAASKLSELGVDVEVLTEDDMKRLGMGALLAVGQGSVRPPRLVVMSWNGGRKGRAPLAVLGKGINFDTGGISIKAAPSMENMKGDMAGAAAVVGLMRALATRRAAVNVVGVIALAENMPDGNAFRPGDILTAMSGKTIEVISTDAEGRLVLADALWYTQDRFKPAAMIDLATLTGAMLVALGHDYAGLFTNTESLAVQLEAAGRATGEKLWHMPMAPAYDKLIDSRFADIKNQGGRNGGSIIAAHFLAHFVNDTPWAHLDIVGTAFGAPSSETNTSWASGFGVALLDRFIRDNYEA